MQPIQQVPLFSWTKLQLYKLLAYLYMDIMKANAFAHEKISKRHFFHEVTHIGLESHQSFSF